MSTDIAGKSYWNRTWATVSNPEFDPQGNYRDRQFAEAISATLSGLPSSAVVLEAGCADSVVLPFVARALGFKIAGIDYSPIGCEKIKQRLAGHGLTADIECCDIFDPPQRLLASSDALMSFGLVEHFADTGSCVGALARLLRPGGRMLTIVPNMHGVIGWLVRTVAPSVYRVHVPLTPGVLADAHRAAGLQVLSSGYLLPADFGVLNFSEADASRFSLFARRVAVAGLARLSWMAWAVDRRVRLPRTQFASPYCVCIAQR